MNLIHIHTLFVSGTLFLVEYLLVSSFFVFAVDAHVYLCLGFCLLTHLFVHAFLHGYKFLIVSFTSTAGEMFQHRT